MRERPRTVRPTIGPWDAVIDRLDSAADARALSPALRALPAAER